MPSFDLSSLLRLHLATLHRAGLGQKLLERFGGAPAVFRAPRSHLVEVEGITARSLDHLHSTRIARSAEMEVRRCEAEALHILIHPRVPLDPARLGPGAAFGPGILAPLPHMPLVLFCRGEWSSSDARSAGIVGSRRPSPYGRRQARHFASRLAGWGVTVVSGLARGIDGIAQESALDAGGRTIAVLGSGLGRIYPREHSRLVDRITSSDQGAVMTEFPFEAAPRSFHFPQRNRVLSGLSRVLVVIEASERSGSLITVDWALRQGKSIYALPGRVDQPQALGALALLRDGATPALDPGDLREDLGLSAVVEGDSGKERLPGSPRLSGPFARELEQLFAEDDHWDPDAIAGRLSVESSVLLGELARLEIEGTLRRDPDGRFILGED